MGATPHNLERPHVDKEASNAWLNKGLDIFAETEGFVVAIEERVKTRNYSKHNKKDQTVTDDRCHLGCTVKVTIEHTTGECQLLTQKEARQCCQANLPKACAETWADFLANPLL